MYILLRPYLTLPHGEGVLPPSAEAYIAEAFAKHFRSTCTSLNNDQNDRIRLLYLDKRHYYIGDPHLNMYTFDTELGVGQYK